MKTWRLLLLVVLVVLLPLRGAMAATMLCSPAGHQAVVPAGADKQAPMDHAHHVDHADHAHHDPAGDAEPEHAHSHTGSCSVCANYCSVTPLLMAVPRIQQPAEAQRLRYPALAAPAPLFLSDGQERPPRST